MLNAVVLYKFLFRIEVCKFYYLRSFHMAVMTNHCNYKYIFLFFSYSGVVDFNFFTFSITIQKNIIVIFRYDLFVRSIGEHRDLRMKVFRPYLSRASCAERNITLTMDFINRSSHFFRSFNCSCLILIVISDIYLLLEVLDRQTENTRVPMTRHI